MSKWYVSMNSCGESKNEKMKICMPICDMYVAYR